MFRTFYLGTVRPHWLRKLNVPIFMSRVNLVGRKSFPRARHPWALDSGAFSEISKHGRWTLSVREYAAEIDLYASEIGKLRWAAPQDWMCEPGMIAKTGLSVEGHQQRTIENFLELRDRSTTKIIPVLQGYTLDEYLDHVDQYDRAGVDLRREPTVGIGSVCRRQGMREAEVIVRTIADLGITLHGFGVKITGLGMFADALVSADSMAWSYSGWRRMREGFLPRQQGNCAHCQWYALYWRDKCLRKIKENESRVTAQRAERRAQLTFTFPTISTP